MLLAVVILAGSVDPLAAAQKPWRGFLWPVKTEQSFELSLGAFATLAACRKTAVIHVLAAGWADDAFWECGLNCVRREYPKVSWKCEDRTQ